MMDISGRGILKEIINNGFVQSTGNIYGRDSSVIIATRYGLDGPGIESR